MMTFEPNTCKTENCEIYRAGNLAQIPKYVRIYGGIVRKCTKNNGLKTKITAKWTISSVAPSLVN